MCIHKLGTNYLTLFWTWLLHMGLCTNMVRYCQTRMEYLSKPLCTNEARNLWTLTYRPIVLDKEHELVVTNQRYQVVEQWLTKSTTKHNCMLEKRGWKSGVYVVKLRKVCRIRWRKRVEKLRKTGVQSQVRICPNCELVKKEIKVKSCHSEYSLNNLWYIHL